MSNLIEIAGLGVIAIPVLLGVLVIWRKARDINNNGGMY